MPPKKMLFVGLAHSAKDSRLCYFLAKAIHERFPSVECLYLGRDSIDPLRLSNEYMTVVRMPGKISPLKRYFWLHDMEILAEHIRSAGVDLVQISDSRELLLGYALKTKTSIPVIFDSHEDYFNQKYEYLNKSIKGLYHGVVARAEELLTVRFMDAVFCTDHFLERFYAHPVFASKSVTMVRNIPPRDTIRNEPIVNERDTLKLLYIGSVNRLRGIIETAVYCERFNSEPRTSRRDLTLSFHVFSPPHEVIDNLASNEAVVHHGFVPRPVIEQQITDFDIGISLLLPSRKFERNIPIKNFEYMAMGLPVLTSNFGPLKKYVGEADGGITINPQSYTEFKDAIIKFKDPAVRRRFGANGIAYAKAHFRRDQEVAPYLETVGALLGLLEND